MLGSLLVVVAVFLICGFQVFQCSWQSSIPVPGLKATLEMPHLALGWLSLTPGNQATCPLDNWDAALSSEPFLWVAFLINGTGLGEQEGLEKEANFNFVFVLIFLCVYLEREVWFSHFVQENISCVPILGAEERKFSLYNSDSSFELMANFPPPSNNFGQTKVSKVCISRWDCWRSGPW